MADPATLGIIGLGAALGYGASSMSKGGGGGSTVTNVTAPATNPATAPSTKKPMAHSLGPSLAAASMVPASASAIGAGKSLLGA